MSLGRDLLGGRVIQEVRSKMSGLGDLFGTSKKDDKLVDLFGKSSGPVKRTVTQRTILKMPKKEETAQESSASTSDSDSESASENEGDEDEEMEDSEESKSVSEVKKPKKKSSNEEDDDLESKYLEKLLKEPETNDKAEAEESDDGDDSEEEEESKSAPAPSAQEAKSIDFKEKEVEKAQRTIFVGNLASFVITSKKDYKDLKKFFAKFGAIESVRFRSISFNEPIPRKAAFVKQKLHESRDSINAYIVFKEQQAARKSLEANGQLLFNLHIRVDSVSHPAKIDNKRTIFVGNLDFEEKEEELWRIFADCGEIESVRIVRDATTNMGKGFGYVQFKDFTSVSKALLLHEKKLGSKKRKLRITRSKRVKPTGGKPDQKRGPQGQNQRALQNLTDDQKTKLGRAQRVLGKADRFQAGKVAEGQRAKKGDRLEGVKNGKNRIKKPRIRQRSTDFKNKNKAAAK